MSGKVSIPSNALTGGTPVRFVAVDKIRTDCGTQVRELVNEDVVQKYVDALNDGHDFPPIDVFHDGGDHYLADGFHRFEAYKRTGSTELLVNLHKGDVRAARLFSCGANEGHGQHRTEADRRRAVLILLEDPEWSKMSVEWKAKTARVRKELVVSVTRDMSTSAFTSSGGTSERVASTNATTRLTREEADEMRKDIAQEFAKNPDATIRAVAEETGASVGMVQKVKKQILGGDQTPTTADSDEDVQVDELTDARVNDEPAPDPAARRADSVRAFAEKYVLTHGRQMAVEIANEMLRRCGAGE